MHYFKRNIGDYHKKAGRLSMLEHGAYTLLLDACYDRERFPTIAEAIDWCWARSVDEVAAVEFVLSKFFTLDGERYVQTRIAQEIDAYHAIATKNKEIAEKREAEKRTKREAESTKRAQNSTKREPVVNEPTPNQEPLTTNQEPLTNKDQETCATATHAAPVDDLFAKFWSLYPSKKDKAKAAKAFAKLKITDDLFNQIISGLAAQVASHDWTKDGGKYIPMPTTWLNGKRWEDEVKPAPSGNVHAFPGQSRHTGFDQRDYTSGLTQREDGTYAF